MFDHIFIGVMHSGKSEKLISLYNQSLLEGKKAYLMLPSILFTKTPFIEVYNQKRYTDIFNLKDIKSILKLSQNNEELYFYVDEIEFVSDKEYELLKEVNCLPYVHISCAGLKENYLIENFVQTDKVRSLTNLIPESPKYMCEECKQKQAVHNILLKKGKIVQKSLNKNNLVIETDEAPLYKSVCSDCRQKYINSLS